MDGIDIGYSSGIDNIAPASWEDVVAVDTALSLLDSIHCGPENAAGHYLYNFFSEWSGEGDGESLTPSNGLRDVLISQDSSGNYIKWQISEIESSTEMVEGKYPDITVNGIILRWAVDSCGNGKFLTDPVSTTPAATAGRTKILRSVQSEQRLQFPGYSALSISLYKTNGRCVAESDGMGNFIDLSGVAPGLYIGRIRGKDMEKIMRFSIE